MMELLRMRDEQSDFVNMLKEWLNFYKKTLDERSISLLTSKINEEERILITIEKCIKAIKNN